MCVCVCTSNVYVCVCLFPCVIECVCGQCGCLCVYYSMCFFVSVCVCVCVCVYSLSNLNPLTRWYTTRPTRKETSISSSSAIFEYSVSPRRKRKSSEQAERAPGKVFRKVEKCSTSEKWVNDTFSQSLPSCAARGRGKVRE